jgi:DNA-nicking Smr family endonuclease
MKLRISDNILRSFEDLKPFIHKFPDRNPSISEKPGTGSTVKCDPSLSNHDLFINAMEDVIPLPNRNLRKELNPKRSAPPDPSKTEMDVLDELKDLIRHGTGFVVSDTPEYMEGTGHRVHPKMAHFLHHGNLAIQAHLDLHGFSVANAREEFDRFFTEAVRTGKRQLLIIHGRGLSSPLEPVLKTKVVSWLRGAPWGKWVFAFASARICHGGAGATYVLLRSHPLTHRFRKQKKPVYPA